MKITRKHLKIKGKVQGVGYRQSALILAQKLEIKGWVKNTHEGEVEIIAEGAASRVSVFVEWCHEGPRHSVVTEVVVLDSKEITHFEFQDFTIQKTS